MEPALCELFCQEYTREMNRLRIEHNGTLESAKSELAKTARDIDRLVQAIMDGVPGSQVKDKMAQLETRKAELQSQLDQAEEEMPVLIHPNMGGYYRDQVAGLREALTDENHRLDAVEIMRRLIDRIELMPIEHEGRKAVAVNLHGHLAGILSLAAKTEKSLDDSDFSVESVAMVAGAGFEPATFRL